MTNSVDPDQTAPMSSLFWVHAVYFYIKFVSNVWQLFAADDFSRRHFQMHFFLGALRVKTFIKKALIRSPILRKHHLYLHLMVMVYSDNTDLENFFIDYLQNFTYWTLFLTFLGCSLQPFDYLLGES